MTILYLPTLISFLAFLVLGAYVFLRDRSQRLNMFFALAMGSLALMEFGNFMVLIHMGSGFAVFWKRISFLGECLVPGTWLMFSLTFARREPWYQSKEWKTVMIGIGAASTVFLASIRSDLFVSPGSSSASLFVGGIGRAFYIFSLMVSIGIVASLEHGVRQLKGAQRERIGSFTIGLGGLFAFMIYLASQTLLFSKIKLAMTPVNSLVFIICSIVLAFSVVRHKLMNVNLYMSRFVVYNSLTLLVVGGYLVFVGLVSQVVRSFNLLPEYPLEILFFFVAILIFVSLFLSDRIRWKARVFINRHFYRSRFDYRGEWLRFSEGLSLKLDIEDLAHTMVAMVRDSIGVERASLWLYEEETGYLSLVDSPVSGEPTQLNTDQKFLRVLLQKKTPFPMDVSWARAFVSENSQILEKLQPALLVPLVSGKEMVGVVLLGKKTTGEGFLADDMDLLRSAAAQMSSAIMNARLSEQLIKAKEREVFHRLSSFVMHDLKNLVSTLSLVVENAGQHMANPEFQRDAFKTVESSTRKMEALIARLSNNAAPVKPTFEKVDLNESVSQTLGRMGQNGLSRRSVEVDLGQIPRVLADRDQIEKVIVNLVLNAFDAVDTGGLITIKTEANEDKVILSVADNGCGMSPDYIQTSLFRPFNSTKKKGLGIGLHQCKTIVEGHRGSIAVESKEGKGSTFRVILPAA
jgi:hypothetical protein